jgi:hypothetical protein
MAASHKGFYSYKLPLYKKTDSTQNMTKNKEFFITFTYCSAVVKQDHVTHFLIYA